MIIYLSVCLVNQKTIFGLCSYACTWTTCKLSAQYEFICKHYGQNTNDIFFIIFTKEMKNFQIRKHPK